MEQLWYSLFIDDECRPTTTTKETKGSREKRKREKNTQNANNWMTQRLVTIHNSAREQQQEQQFSPHHSVYGWLCATDDEDAYMHQKHQIAFSGWLDDSTSWTGTILHATRNMEVVCVCVCVNDLVFRHFQCNSINATCDDDVDDGDTVVQTGILSSRQSFSWKSRLTSVAMAMSGEYSLRLASNEPYRTNCNAWCVSWPIKIIKMNIKLWP